MFLRCGYAFIKPSLLVLILTGETPVFALPDGAYILDPSDLVIPCTQETVMSSRDLIAEDDVNCDTEEGLYPY